jgi:hypothetical protein
MTSWCQRRQLYVTSTPVCANSWWSNKMKHPFNCSHVSCILPVECKVIPLEAWTDSWGFRRSRVPEFLHYQRMKMVRLSAVSFCPQEITLLLFSVRGCVDHRDLLRPAGLEQWTSWWLRRESKQRLPGAVPQLTHPPTLYIKCALTNFLHTNWMHVFKSVSRNA